MSRSAFVEPDRSARGHLALRSLSAVGALVDASARQALAAGTPADAVTDEHAFVRGYLAELDVLRPVSAAPGAFGWVAAAVAEWESAAPSCLPLLAAARALRLQDRQLTALALAGLVEEDARFGAVFATLQPCGARRPTLGLLHRVAGAGAADGVHDAWSLCRPLLDTGLLVVLNPGDPRDSWQLRVPAELWAALSGALPREPLPGVSFSASAELPALDELTIDGATRRRLREAAALLAGGDARVLLLRGAPGSEREEAAAAVARSLGGGRLRVETAATVPPEGLRTLGPLATLTGAVPTFVLELGPGERFELPSWVGFTGPVVVVAGADGGLGGEAAERLVVLEMAPDPPAVRARHWRRALPEAGAALQAELAAAHALGGAHVRRAASVARAHAALDGRPSVTRDDVRAGVRAVQRQLLDGLAARLDDAGGWERLALHPSTASALRGLERRCRERERLAAALGAAMPGGMNRGVRALFQGPSGTGKTLAARVLASTLRLDVYRVDLSSLVSKYIGETEKNLSRVLGRAEALDVVLLLDEGDSLLGRRTEVRSSNDRWANLETNYLLQRLESYTGIVVVTTNAPGAIDAAFHRRMDAVVRFHAPGAAERGDLWALHLPPDHAVPDDALDDLADRHELTGGQIRNAAVTAALLALDRGSARVHAADVERAVAAELRKAGGTAGRPAVSERGGSAGALAAFLGSVS